MLYSIGFIWFIFFSFPQEILEDTVELLSVRKSSQIIVLRTMKQLSFNFLSIIDIRMLSDDALQFSRGIYFDQTTRIDPHILVGSDFYSII